MQYKKALLHDYNNHHDFLDQESMRACGNMISLVVGRRRLIDIGNNMWLQSEKRH